MYGAFLVAALQVVSVQAGADGAEASATVSVTMQSDTTRPVPDSADLATAFADSATRELVRLARERRGGIDSTVFHYTALSRQRVSVGVRALRRDRILYRRETASRIDWFRDRPSRVRVVGAREATPIVTEGIRIPEELEDWARSFVPAPGSDRLYLAPTEDGFAWHPLIQGGEALYRYAIGDSTVIRLPDGRQIRLVELRVTPRERDIRLVTGSFWVERDDHAIVQAVFRPASDFDLERDLARIDPGEAGTVDDVPGFLKPVIFDMEYATVEYGLWEMRWWMPTLVAFRASVRVGALTLPITLEIRYGDYGVEADPRGLPPLPPVIRELAGDTTITPQPYEMPVTVVLADSAVLLDSPELLEDFYAPGESLITGGEIRDLGDRLRLLPPTPWAATRPRVTFPWEGGQGLVRYNRVEELSAGARVDWDLGRARLDLTARLGTADLEPRAELGVETRTLRHTWRLAGYHRLAVADPSLRPLGLGNSILAFLAARDDGTYFGATGAELTVGPRSLGWVRGRLYAERQTAVAVNTDLSVPHLFRETRTFRPNIQAQSATQVGLSATAGREWGQDPSAARWGAWLDLTAETGDFRFLRPGLTLRTALPVAGLVVAAEVGAGTTVGTAPVQSLWYLGGAANLRGFPGGSLWGSDYGRVRLELSTPFPGARIAVFSDAGWAGSFDAYAPDDVAVSVGLGASFLDGLLRMDLARAVRPDAGFRVEMYLDAIL